MEYKNLADMLINMLFLFNLLQIYIGKYVISGFITLSSVKKLVIESWL